MGSRRKWFLIRIYLVGVADVESNIVVSIHLTKRGALKAWNKQRLQMLTHYEEMKNVEEWDKEFIKDLTPEQREYWIRDHHERYQEMIDNMQCTDPAKISNSVHDTPYIKKYRLEW